MEGALGRPSNLTVSYMRPSLALPLWVMASSVEPRARRPSIHFQSDSGSPDSSRRLDRAR